MKSIRVILTGVLAALFMQPVSALAEDIDIYSGLGVTGNVPNILIVMDTSANFGSRASGTCTYADGSGSPSAGNTPAGIEQCALYNTIKGLPVKADGSALINIGFMVYNSVGVAAAYPSAGCASTNNGGCLLIPLTAMTEANKTTVLNWIKGWVLNDIKTNAQGNALAMQEAWAYYAGGEGASTRNYSRIKPTAGCQKNFVVFIGNSYETNGTPGDGGSVSPLGKLTDAGGDTSIINIPSGTYGLPAAYNSCGSYSFNPRNDHTEPSGLYADEWTRFMAKADLYTADDQPQGTQNIVTYTIGALGPDCRASYAALLKSMAEAGNGKYFPTDANNADSIAQALLKIFNEVQAVNSVFSSSSLPVSVNAQGTYLNQIYMGMFRPDPGALPRWVGNLKQYKFIFDPTTGILKLGDSIGEPAIFASTGFLSPNAISYWTCSRSDNSFLSGLSTEQSSTLTSQGQICANDPVGGFWKNFSSMSNSAGKGFDMSDGELVEKGAVAQQIRLANLTNDYAANPRTPRKLYTYCPSGASCQAALTHDDNAFATNNTGITAGMLGTDITANISTLTRSGTVVTVTTSGNHGFSTNDSITIANAAQSEYNGTFTIEKITDTQFKWTYGASGNPNSVHPTTPVNPATNFTVQKAGAPIVVSLSRTNDTVTATASAAHGFANGSKVVIADAMQNEYNGSFDIATSAGSSTFTFTVKERPPIVAGSGATTCTATYTYATSPSNRTATVTVNAWNATTPGIQRAYGSLTVTVNTNTNISTGSTKASSGNSVTLTGCVDEYGVAVPAYNVSTTIASVSGNSFTFNLPSGAIGPKTPADIATGKTYISASPVATSHTIDSLTRTDTAGTAATVTATVTAHGYANNDIVSIGYTGTVPSSHAGYLGNYTISNTTANTFDYTITTTPASPASSATGATLTATRSGGFVASDRSALINWVRGEDNRNDETGPGSGVTIRPSVHGDVLHSRPVVINYGGAAISITGTSDSGSTRTATASATDVAKIGATGARQSIKFPTGNICTATVASATTFTYPTSNCGNSGEQSVVTGTSNVVVYYGDNGGVFHAVNGNQTNPLGSTLPAPGSELWGFIPKEHFIKLNRLRSNSPQLNLPSTPPGISPLPQTKNYFIDGATGVYQLLDVQGTTLTAYIYLSMRRGGRMIYALDVSDPQAPRFLWKVDNTTANMSELGQTWSAPKVAKVKGHTNPVLIFGAGYDTNQDVDPPTSSDTMGRGIFVLDAITGSVVWRATYGANSGSNSGTTFTTSGTPPTALSDRMSYSIPADITLMDRNNDGYIDRLYAADTGGRVWRVDTEPGGSTSPSSWKLHRLATLGECGSLGTSVCRKFFYPPEVINTSSYDAVIVGSGDREHPLYNNTAATGKQNMVFLLKDTYTGTDATGLTRIRHTNDETDLCNATSVTSSQCTTCLDSQRGYYINLQDGEKVVNAPLVTAGYVYFSTNKPVAPSATSCVANLGEARGYRLSPFTCEYSSVVFAGGGLPPSPVSGVVNIEKADGTIIQVPFLIGGANPGCSGADCESALGGQKPVINVSTSRTRTYWYKEGK